MQGGVRDWVRARAHPGGNARRRVPPAVLLSVLCASAFCPLLVAAAGLSGAVAVAGFGVLSSVGGGVLGEVLTGTLDRLRAQGRARAPSAAELTGQVAGQLQAALAAGDARARELRDEIAAVLRRIDAGGTALRAAIEEGGERTSRQVIDALGELGSDFAEFGFLMRDVAAAAAAIQQTLDVQAAAIRGVAEQNTQQSADIRLVREALAVIESRTRDGAAGQSGAPGAPGRVHGCPYRGLLPFGEDDADVFYGRERLTTELTVQLAQRLTRGGLLFVTGPSGAGKSSLLHAGLLPALARGVQIPGSDRWPRPVITPTADPLTELAAALAVLSGGDALSLRESLARHPEQAHLAAWQASQTASGTADARLVLAVDQFEQVFTLAAGPDAAARRQAFITALCAMARTPVGPGGHAPAVVLIAVRGDFWDRCAAHPELAHDLRDGQFLVGPMTEAELRLAISGPAEAAGLQIAAGLAGAIAGELHASADDEAGSLPLLSQAMLLTWQNREGSQLTQRAYAQSGGVSQAVQTSADAVYGLLTSGQQELSQEILRRMTVTGRDGRITRRPVSRADLYAGHPDTAAAQIDVVLEVFAAGRLVVLNEDTAQISHDVLLRAWPRLRGWLEADQASWILHAELADATARWRGGSGDPSFLYRGTQLETIKQAMRRWAADPHRFPAVTATEQDFLRASERAAARSVAQRRAVLGTLTVLLIASLTGTGLAIRANSNANRQRSAALAAGLATESEDLDNTNPVEAAQLAAAAWRSDPAGPARDSLLDVLAQPDREVLRDGGSPVDTIAFSPDGKLLATGEQNGLARLWDTATHRQAGPAFPVDTGQYGSVESLAFSPNGRLLVTAGSDGVVRLWNVATHRPVGPPIIRGGGTVYGVAVNQGGTLLATAGQDGTARLFSMATQRQIGAPIDVPAPRRGVKRAYPASVAFSPDGKLLATVAGPPYGTVQLWSVRTRRKVGAPMTGPGGGSTAVAFSPDGRLLATVTGNLTAQLWRVSTQRPLGGQFGVGVSAVAFSPDQSYLATGGSGGDQLWNVRTRQRAGMAMDAGNGPGVNALAFSPGGRMLATGNQDGTARLLSLSAFSQLGPPVAAGSPDYAPGPALAFSPSGALLAVTGSHGTAQLWRASTGIRAGPAIRADPEAHDPGVLAIAFSPDGAVLATAGGDGTARLWQVATHREAGRPLDVASAVRVVGQTSVTVLAFSRNGRLLATASSTGALLVWNVATHRLAWPPIRLGNVGDYFPAVAFSLRGDLLAAGTSSGLVRLWDVATHHATGPSLSVGSNDSVYAVAFSPGGSVLAAGAQDGTVKLWNVATGREVGAPLTADSDSGQNGGVFAVAFSPDGRLLATGAGDGSVRLWDVATGQQIGETLSMDHSPVTAVAFSPDGRTLATASDDGTARMWSVAFPAGLVGAVCRIARGAVLTHHEWAAAAPGEPYQPGC
jgi:WD40 repeat protein/uncharacterized membrane protein